MGDNFRSGRRMRQGEETIHWEENKKKQKIKCRTRQKERKNKQTFKNRWDYWTTGRRIHNDILEGKKKQNNNKPRGGKIMTSDTLTQNRHIHTHTHPHIDVHTHTLTVTFLFSSTKSKFWFCHFSVGSLEGAGSGEWRTCWTQQGQSGQRFWLLPDARNKERKNKQKKKEKNN